MQREIIVTADDFSISEGVTDTILEAVLSGAVHGTSVIANGKALSYGAKELKHHKDISIGLHFNIVEGRSLILEERTNYLVDQEGYFCRSFVSLWLLWLLASKSKREALRRELRKELISQWNTLEEAFGRHASRIDSHQHVHLIPWIFEEVASVTKDRSTASIRLIKEPLFLAWDGPRSFFVYLGPNLIKHVLLNFLSKRAGKELRRESGEVNTHSAAGVLWSGNIVMAPITTLLAELGEQSHSVPFEIIVHPGEVRTEEKTNWHARHKRFLHFYSSAGRKDERKAVASEQFSDLLSAYRNGTLHAPRISGRQVLTIFKYLVSGTLAALVHLGLLYAFTEWVGIWYLISTALAFLVAFSVSFTLQKFWTFEDHETHELRGQIAKYFATTVSGLFANVGGVYVLVAFAGIWYMAAQTIVLIMVAVVSFIIYKYVIFAPAYARNH